MGEDDVIETLELVPRQSKVIQHVREKQSPRTCAKISRRRPDDPRLRERLVALARERRRFGYPRLLFLRLEGLVVNHKRLFGVYREERLMVRKRRGRKRALGTRTPMPVPARPNEL